MRLAVSIRFLILTVPLTVLISCSGGSPTLPPPPPPVEQLQIACPVEQLSEATVRDGAEIHFDSPQPTGGQQPYTVECTPGSGEVFPLGDSEVTCTARDAMNTQASCNFAVRVRVSRSLSKAKFMAFGDSITSGVVSLAPLVMLAGPDTYPFKLEQLLRQRYPTQDIVVTNQGESGERTSAGADRLPKLLDSEKPDVLLLLEGVNAVTLVPPRSQELNLGDMIEAAQDRNIAAIIATVMPISDEREAHQRGDVNGAIRDLNARIFRLADHYDLGPPVDLYALFEANPHLLGTDGLHPTLEGQTRIAEAFRDAIVQRYDVQLGSSSILRRPGLRRIR